jgi:hypothetical protein
MNFGLSYVSWNVVAVIMLILSFTLTILYFLDNNVL